MPALIFAQGMTDISRLQESAKLKDVLAAMQEDVSYIRLVNIALTRPDQQEVATNRPGLHK